MSNSRSVQFGYLVIDPAREIVVHNDIVTITSDGAAEQYPLSAFENNPLKPLELELSQRKRQLPEFTDSESTNMPSFIGGGLGFVGYDCGRYFERVAGAAGHPTEPEIFFLFTRSVIVFDYERDVVQLIVTDEPGWLLETLRDRLANPAEVLACVAESQVTVSYKLQFSRTEFEARVQSALEYIRAGDVFQLVLGNTLQLDVSPNPLKLYATLKRLNPSPFHYFIRTGNSCFVGASPETMLRGAEYLKESGEREKTVSMRLVAGTYPRGKQPEKETIANFLADEKERAEHLMLIDHSRNDIGRVSQIGKVRVSDMFSIETYSDLHHLVSQVSGVLRAEETLLSALRSAFPISTLTGTPKIRAMEIIAELEGPSRGIFGGAVVMLGDNGVFDSGVLIRGASITPEGTTIKVGCGIVNDSIPEREFDECLWKAQAMLRSIGAVIKQ